MTEEGELPGGLQAVAVRGDRRAVIGTGVPGTGDALWVEAEEVAESEPTPAVGELAHEYRAVLENILHNRGGAVAAQLHDISDPGRLADVSGYSPDLSLTQKVEVLDASARRPGSEMSRSSTTRAPVVQDVLQHRPSTRGPAHPRPVSARTQPPPPPVA